MEPEHPNPTYSRCSLSRLHRPLQFVAMVWLTTSGGDGGCARRRGEWSGVFGSGGKGVGGSRVAVCCNEAVCCSALQRVAVRCSVLQCVVWIAVCCGVLQCVAVCCSVLQCVAALCQYVCVIKHKWAGKYVEASQILRAIERCCTTVRHNASHCNTLQHTAIHYTPSHFRCRLDTCVRKTQRARCTVYMRVCV